MYYFAYTTAALQIKIIDYLSMVHIACTFVYTGLNCMSFSSKSAGLLNLLQPLGGLAKRMSRVRTESDVPRFVTQRVHLGDISQAWPQMGQSYTPGKMSGVGVGLDAEEAAIPALAEGLERYCACVYTKDQFLWTTANELGVEALDLDAIPRCSETELADPQCPLAAPDKTAPIRWVRALSLLDGRVVYVPVVMTYLYAGFVSPAERIAYGISTGCAAHISFEQALTSAILEVIERDAISVTWLQKLGLPEIEIDDVAPKLAPFWERYQRSSVDLECHFFDATTDIGIPTVYGLQLSRASRHVVTVVCCSTSMDPVDAVIKVMRDVAATRIALQNVGPCPYDWADFTDVAHGGTYMARPEQSGAFKFLLRSPQKRRLTEIGALTSRDEKQALQLVLEHLRRKRLDVYAVDLSTDEALRSGLRVVRVIIPGLQPLGFQYRARYLGHARLYQAPREMGYPVRSEEQLNPWPQPFA
jgi:ribosomal protein S12 methylthiotransferase accessory factor